MRDRHPAHLAKVAALPCVVCGAWPVHVHHIKRRPDGQKYGLGQKAPDTRTIPLCPYHHQHGPQGEAFHAGPKAFERAHGNEMDLLAMTEAMLALVQ